MARPKSIDSAVGLSLTLSGALAAALAAVASADGVSRSEAARRLIELGLDARGQKAKSAPPVSPMTVPERKPTVPRPPRVLPKCEHTKAMETNTGYLVRCDPNKGGCGVRKR